MKMVNQGSVPLYLPTSCNNHNKGDFGQPTKLPLPKHNFMPLLWLSLAFIAGIILASTLPLPTTPWIVLIAGTLLLAFARPLLSRTRLRTFATLLAPRRIPISIPILLLALALGGGALPGQPA